MTDANPTPPGDFPSFEALRMAHSELLRQQRQAEDPAAGQAGIMTFLERAQASGAHLEEEDERQSAQSLLDYWSTSLFRQGIEVPPRILNEFDASAAPEIPDDACPYQGLSAFNEDDSANFFGRQKVIEGLVEHVRTGRLLAVVGPSGSGKSSVVRAGLIPTLQTGVVPGSQSWVYLPSFVPGSRPLESLSNVLRLPTAAAVAQTPQAGDFLKDPQALKKWAAVQFSSPLVLVVDQFEEIFTLCEDIPARQAFIANLIELVKAQPQRHTVILTMRTDFESKLPLLGEFQGMVENNIQRLPPLNAGELRQAIEGPAKRVGLKFETGVIEALLNDILGEPAALPLLQFTLLKLWEARRRNRVTWESFRHLGGARQALATSADEFFRSLIPEDQVTAREILLRLVQPGEGLEMTSRRLVREDLYTKNFARERVDRVLQRFIAERLLRLTHGDRPEDDQIEVAHEALIRNWPALAEWYQEELEEIKERRRLTTAADNWERLNHDPASLLRGRLLEQALKYTDLTRPEQALVQASLQAAQAETKKEKRRQRIITTISIAAVLFGIIATIASVNAYGAANLAFKALITATNALGAAQEQAAIATNALGLVQQQSEDLRLALTEVSQQKQYAELQQATATSALGQYQAQATAASQAQQIASQQDLLVQSLSTSSSQIDLSLLLALEASRPDDSGVISSDTTRNLLDVLRTNPRLLTYLHGNSDPIIPVSGPVYNLAFDPASGSLVASRDNGFYQVWNANERELLENNSGLLSGPVYSLATSRSGALAVGGCAEIDLASGFCSQGGGYAQDSLLQVDALFKLNGHSNAITALAFSPDGRLLVSTSSDSLLLWDAITGLRLNVQPGSSSIAISPDSIYLARAAGASIAIDRLSSLINTDTNIVTTFLEGGHSAPVSALAYSPDGSYLASGSQDNRVVLWDLSGRRDPIFLERHTFTINNLVFSPDSTLLASASGDGTVILWRLTDIINTGSEARLASEILTGHTDAVLGLAFSPDGRLLASSGRDGAIILWNMAESTLTGKSFPIQGSTSVMTLAFPDEQTLTAAWQGAQLSNWDISSIIFSDALSTRSLSELLQATWKLKDTSALPGSTQSVLVQPGGASTALVPIDVLGAIAGPNDVRLDWSAARTAGLSFGYVFATDGLDPSPAFLRQWAELERQRLLRGVAIRYQPGFSPERYFSIIDALLSLGPADGHPPFNVHLGAFSPTGWLPHSTYGAALGMELPPAVFVDNYPDSDPQTILIELAQLLDSFALYYGISPVIYTSPSVWNQLASQMIVQAVLPVQAADLSARYPLMVIDPSSANQPTLPSGWSEWAFWEFSPAGGAHPGQADLPLPFLRFNGSPASLSTYFNNLDTGESVNLGRLAELINLDDGTSLGPGFTYTPGTPAAISPDGATLVLGQSDGRILFVNVASGASENFLSLGPGGGVTSLAYSPDGVYLAAGYEDTSIAIWNFNMGFPEGILTGHTSPVLSLAFDAAGAALASGSADGSIYLWDIPTMRSSAGPFSGRAAQVTALAFHPSGRYLFSGSASGSVDYWLVNPEDWRDLACLRAGRNLTMAEFLLYFPGQAYRSTCAQYPAAK